MYQTLRIALSCVILYVIGAKEVLSQERPIVLETKVNLNRSVDLNYTKNDPGTYTVIVSFNSLQNTNASERQVVDISGISGKLLSLSPSDPNKSIIFSYKYNFIRGRVLRKYNQEFQYFLPYKNGVEIKAMEAGYVSARYFGNETPADWKAYSFYTSKEDTVVAARKGLVVEVKDAYDTSNPGTEAYKSALNEVVIEHQDGTFARYRGLKKGIFVEAGQTVLPGTALGMNTRFSAKSSQYSISFHAYYLESDDVESQRDKTLKTIKSLYSSITPHFYTREGESLILEDKRTYTAAFDAELAKKELSKKEIKNFLKK